MDNTQFDPEMEAIGNRKKKIALSISFDPDDKTAMPEVEVSSVSDHDEDDAADDKALGEPGDDQDQAGTGDPAKGDGYMLAQLMDQKQKADDADQQASFDKNKGEIDGHMMAGDSPDKVMGEFSSRAPRSLGERARFELAKKMKK